MALIVLDTVRRDHVAPCGGVPSLTPNLARFAADGTTYCNMVTPGTWTLPVHASLLTGLLPSDHGADFDSGGVEVRSARELKISGLRPDVPTLAELYTRAGFATVMLSANPVLSPETGLLRGFSASWVAGSFAPHHRSKLLPALSSVLDALKEGSRRLFLVVNIMEAHGPWDRVPSGVDAIPPTTRGLDLFRGGEKSLFALFHRGSLSQDATQELLSDLRRVYAWGVRRADRELGEVLSLLRNRGLLNEGATLIVTSDHGEFLGEHLLLDHGRSVENENVRVFAAGVGPSFARGERRDDLVQSQDVFATLAGLAGATKEALPAQSLPLGTRRPLRIAFSTSEADEYHAWLSAGRSGTRRYAAAFRGDARAIWSRAEIPREQSNSGELLIEGSAREAAELESAVRLLVARHRHRGLEIKDSAVLEEQLRALGYIR